MEFLEQEVNGHKVLVDEIMSGRQGVIGLVARCRSCRTTVGTYSMEDYPKYRLAMADAREALKTHVAQPLDDQDGVW